MRLGYLSLLALVACAPVARPHSRAQRGLARPSPSPTISEQQFEKLIPVMIQQVEIIRGLRAKGEIPVETLKREEMVARFGTSSEEVREQHSLESVIWLALGFDLSEIDALDKAPPLVSSGYFDPAKNEVVVEQTGGDARIGATLHEIEHALQHQHFAALWLKRFPDGDHQLAASALGEGDADLTALALLALANDVPFRRMIQLWLSRKPNDQPRWGTLARVYDELRRFPYSGGFRLLAAVYQLGGFPLVDEVFSHPPASSAQVLHPEKYLTGIQPSAVPELPLPDGYLLARQTRMGELGTRGALSACLRREVALAAAEGWAGDALSLVARVKGHNIDFALLWSTIWENDVAAARFAKALHDASRCWHKQVGRSDVGSMQVSASTEIRQVRNRVAFVRGLDGGGAKMAELLLAGKLEIPAASPPPLVMDRKLPEPFSTEKLAKAGTVLKQHYSSAELGLTATIPASHLFQMSLAGIDLRVVRTGGSPAWGLFHLDSLRFSDEHARAFGESFAKSLTQNHDATLVGERAIELPLGSGTLSEWTVPSTNWRGEKSLSTTTVETLVIPACGGSASFEFALLFRHEQAQADLEDWMGSFQPGASPPPACELLR